MKLYPLGGLGEVGKNITLYECQEDMLLVDCGSVSYTHLDVYKRQAAESAEDTTAERLTLARR